MSKKYYWLKLKENFFTQPKIKKLRKIAGGDTYTVIYLKLQLLSLKNEGKLFFEGIEDNFIEELSLTIDEDVENVKVTVMYLMQQGLMEEVKEDEYALIETMSSIGSETASAKRVRNHRERKKTLLCNTNVTNCITEIEIDIEKDIDIEKEIDKDKEKKDTFKSLVEEYTNNNDLKISLFDYIEMRKKVKGFTIKALKLNLNKLTSLTNDDLEKIEIVNNAVMNSWKSFYPLRKGQANNGSNIGHHAKSNEYEYPDER